MTTSEQSKKKKKKKLGRARLPDGKGAKQGRPARCAAPRACCGATSRPCGGAAAWQAAAHAATRADSQPSRAQKGVRSTTWPGQRSAQAYLGARGLCRDAGKQRQQQVRAPQHGAGKCGRLRAAHTTGPGEGVAQRPLSPPFPQNDSGVVGVGARLGVRALGRQRAPPARGLWQPPRPAPAPAAARRRRGAHSPADLREAAAFRASRPGRPAGTTLATADRHGLHVPGASA